MGSGDLEVLYHFCEGPSILTLRVPVSRDGRGRAEPMPRHPGSERACKRELMEFFRIVVEGSPDTSRLYLPDDRPYGDLSAAQGF